MLTRGCTWENSPYRATAATAAIKSPVTTYSFLPVAQYSITKNTANSTSASPSRLADTWGRPSSRASIPHSMNRAGMAQQVSPS